MRDSLTQIPYDLGMARRVGRPAAIVRSGMNVKECRALVRATPGFGGKLGGGVRHRFKFGAITATVERDLDDDGASTGHRDRLLLPNAAAGRHHVHWAQTAR